MFDYLSKSSLDLSKSIWTYQYVNIENMKELKLNIHIYTKRTYLYIYIYIYICVHIYIYLFIYVYFLSKPKQTVWKLF